MSGGYFDPCLPSKFKQGKGFLEMLNLNIKTKFNSILIKYNMSILLASIVYGSIA